MGLKQYLAVVAVAGVAQAWAVQAAPSSDGSNIVRVDNGRCIGPQDAVNVNLRRIIIEKQTKWLGLIEDQDIGISLTTRISGSTTSQTKSAAFAKVLKAPLSPYKTGQIVMAQEHNLLNRFELARSGNVFSQIDIEVALIKTKGKSVAAQILLGAVSATKNLALPLDPFSAAFDVAAAYVDGVFQPLVDRAAEDKEAVSHHISMTVSSTGTCTGDDETTGTKAIVMQAEDLSKAGYVDAARLNDYCFKAELKPSFSLRFAALPATGKCEAAVNFSDVRNSYLFFYVNAVPPEKPKPVPALVAGLAGAGNIAALASDLGSNLQTQGLQPDTAHSFARALLSTASDEKISAAFGVRPATVSAYRDALQRCIANDVSMQDCF